MPVLCLRMPPALLRDDLADAFFAQVMPVTYVCVCLHHGQTGSYMINVLRIDLTIAVFNGFASSVHIKTNITKSYVFFHYQNCSILQL